MKQVPCIVVIYDSVHNSVFESQVVHPLMKMIQANSKLKIVIVSFEKQSLSKKIIQDKIPHHSSLSFISYKKLPYLGTISLYFAAHMLKKLLKNYSEYDLLARGPLAGFICQKALTQESCNTFIVQARGLLAAEYAYEHTAEKSIARRLWHAFRERQFFNLEKKTYAQSYNQHNRFTIEAVSKSLAEYLITTYHANRAVVSVATYDIPATLNLEQQVAWKNETRKELHIAQDAIVYCYNGSIKPWQCPEQVIDSFKEKYQQNSQAFLLILTQHTKQFEKLIMRHAIPSHAYRVLNVSYNDIYRYLACANVGVIFRQPHIVNWVSRPTKALEYKAVGLKIEHNNTVSWLIEHAQNEAPNNYETQEAKSTQEIVFAQTATDLIV